MKAFLLTAFIICSYPVIGQEKLDKLDLRAGAGISILGTDDMVAFNYENEVNLKLNQFLPVHCLSS